MIKFLTVLNNIKKYRDLIYFIAICLLAYLLAYQARQKKLVIVKAKSDSSLYQNNLKELKDANDVKWQMIEQYMLKQEDYLAYIDSLQTVLGKSKGNIKSVDKIVLVKHDTIRIPVVIQHSDSSKYPTYVGEYNNKWDSIRFSVNNEGAVIDYKSTDSLARVVLSKTNIFGSTKNIVIIKNSNPSIHITSGFSFIEKERRTWFSIGPSIEFNPITLKMDWGISLQVPLIQFKR